jgi:hypothetical protein
MVPMNTDLQTDVGLLHVAGGAPLSTPPPGTLARAAPRRPARGRADDLLFITVQVQASGRVPPGLLDHLAQAGADVFYRTPGSVTSALREVVMEVGDELANASRAQEPPARYLGRVVAAVLREDNIYLAQCGPGRLTLIRGDQVSRFSSPEAANRPLGTAPNPFVRYHHLQVRPGDTLLMMPFDDTLWTEGTLSALAGLPPAQAIDRLQTTASKDLSGLLLRVMPHGQVAAPLPAASPPPRRGPATHARRARQTNSLDLPTTPLSKAVSTVREWMSPAGPAIRSGLTKLGQAFVAVTVRLAPGLADTPRPGQFPPAMLAGTAVAVPLIVLVIVSVVYFKRGRTQQYQTYLTQAQQAVDLAKRSQDPVEARAEWILAQQALNQAADYGGDTQLSSIQSEVAAAIDTLDQVVRLDYRPLISGGFGGDARITALAATATDLYVLDAAHQTIYRTWATGRGFEIDSNFECLDGPSSFPGMGTPVDLAVQAAPGALGVEGVVAIDADGTLLYCAPGRRPLTGQLTAPDTGFARIQAIDVFNDTLYVLDPKSNAVWMYDATGGVFSGNPSLYFAEQAPELPDAIDLADAQEELFILHQDGSLDRCQRTTEQQTGGGVHIRVDCTKDETFKQATAAGQSGGLLPGALLTQMDYSPPPEPSLYFLDAVEKAVYHYSMRMVYQGRLESNTDIPEHASAMTLGPPNDLYLAAGGQVYYVQLR